MTTQKLILLLSKYLVIISFFTKFIQYPPDTLYLVCCKVMKTCFYEPG